MADEMKNACAAYALGLLFNSDPTTIWHQMIKEDPTVRDRGSEAHDVINWIKGYKFPVTAVPINPQTHKYTPGHRYLLKIPSSSIKIMWWRITYFYHWVLLVGVDGDTITVRDKDRSWRIERKQLGKYDPIEKRLNVSLVGKAIEGVEIYV